MHYLCTVNEQHPHFRAKQLSVNRGNEIWRLKFAGQDYVITEQNGKMVKSYQLMSHSGKSWTLKRSEKLPLRFVSVNTDTVPQFEDAFK